MVYWFFAKVERLVGNGMLNNEQKRQDELSSLAVESSYKHPKHAMRRGLYGASLWRVPTRRLGGHGDRNQKQTIDIPYSSHGPRQSQSSLPSSLSTPQLGIVHEGRYLSVSGSPSYPPPSNNSSIGGERSVSAPYPPTLKPQEEPPVLTIELSHSVNEPLFNTRELQDKLGVEPRTPESIPPSPVPSNGSLRATEQPLVHPSDLSTIMEADTSGISKHLPDLDTSQDTYVRRSPKSVASRPSYSDQQDTSVLDLSTTDVGREVLAALSASGQRREGWLNGVVVEDVETLQEAEPTKQDPSFNFSALDEDLADLLKYKRPTNPSHTASYRHTTRIPHTISADDHPRAWSPIQGPATVPNSPASSPHRTAATSTLSRTSSLARPITLKPPPATLARLARSASEKSSYFNQRPPPPSPTKADPPGRQSFNSPQLDAHRCFKKVFCQRDPLHPMGWTLLVANRPYLVLPLHPGILLLPITHGLLPDSVRTQEWMGPRTARVFAAAGLLDEERESVGPSASRPGTRFGFNPSRSERDVRSQYAPSRAGFSEIGSSVSWGRRSGSISHTGTSSDIYSAMGTPDSIMTPRTTYSASTAPTSISSVSSVQRHLQSEIQRLEDKHSTETGALLNALADSQRTTRILREENAQLRDRVQALEDELAGAQEALHKLQFTPPFATSTLPRSNPYSRMPARQPAEPLRRPIPHSRLQTLLQSNNDDNMDNYEDEDDKQADMDARRDPMPMNMPTMPSSSSTLSPYPPMRMNRKPDDTAVRRQYSHHFQVTCPCYSGRRRVTRSVPSITTELTHQQSLYNGHLRTMSSAGNISPTTANFSMITGSPRSLDLRSEHERLLGDMPSLDLHGDYESQVFHDLLLKIPLKFNLGRVLQYWDKLQYLKKPPDNFNNFLLRQINVPTTTGISHPLRDEANFGRNIILLGCATDEQVKDVSLMVTLVMCSVVFTATRNAMLASTVAALAVFAVMLVAVVLASSSKRLKAQYAISRCGLSDTGNTYLTLRGPEKLQQEPQAQQES
ncbi:hypothetical protein BC629DRAFT_1438685 [Irpex lacteus]|nr:hypothetical protein BC629DRAFT_1438685 [Irpex lacteus]